MKIVRLRREEPVIPVETLVQGRWLLPEDENAVVVNTLLLKEDPDIKVGAVLVTPPADYSWAPDWNDAVLGEIHGILRPGGRLLLDVYHRGFFESHQGTRQPRCGHFWYSTAMPASRLLRTGCV